MNALAPVEHPSNVDHYRASTNAASLCKEIVVATATNIQGRKYVCVEGWMAIAVAHGCTASAGSVERVDGGVRAVGQIRRMSDGAVIAEAEGFVGEDEPVWFGGETISYGKRKVLPKRADYAIRAMAQTRAISRACRSAFAHVVVMMNAGLSTTPAEEVPDGGFDDGGETQGTVRDEPQGRITEAQWTRLTTMLETARADVKRFCEAYGIRSVRELPASAFDKAIRQLQRKISEASAARDQRSEPAQDAEFDEISETDLPY